MFGRELLRPGMMVHTRDGQKLGKIQSLEADGFIIEKGLIFKKEYSCRYDLVSDVRGDDVIIARAYSDIGREDTSTRSETTGKAGFGTATATPASTEGAWSGTERSSADVTIPVVEEELDVTTHEHQAGAVRVRKDVITEERTVTVPVSHERVTVERVPVSEGTYASSDARISEGEVTVPIREEEVEVHKRPVVREEIRLRKDRVEERRAVSETVRKEDVHIDEDTEEVRRSPGADDDFNTRY